MMGFFSKESPADIRHVADEDLQWISTSNLCLLAMARMMEAQGVDDEPLIEELYRRGASERKAK